MLTRITTYRERREHRVFKLLVEIIGIEGRLVESSDEDVADVAGLVRICAPCRYTLLLTLGWFGQIQKGVSGARSDDTKALKVAVLDWITPRGQPLSPPLTRNVKTDRGFHHERTGALLCPAGLDWSNIECVSSFRVTYAPDTL